MMMEPPMQICRRGHPLLLAAVCLQLLGLPLLSEGQSTLQLGRGALGEFGAAITLPEVEDQATRLMLGDAHGFLHVYEQRSEAEAFDEIWVSEYFEGPIAGVFIADINLDKLDEIILFTESGRFHFLDVRDYHTIWSNPPTDYKRISAMHLYNVDDDPQEEILFVGDGRLIVYDGRDQFEEWRSDQDNITATEMLVGDVDGDEVEEIILNDGFIFDARYRDLEWQSPESFGERIGLLDIDDDSIPEVIGEFSGRQLRIFAIDLRRMKASRR